MMIKTLEKILESKYAVFVVLILPAFLLYLKSLHYGFTSLDDQWLIVGNSNLANGWAGFKKIWGQATYGIYYRPLLISSFFLDYAIGALSPFIYHVNNLVLHLTAVLLLYRFLCLNKVDKNPAIVLSLLFSVHPIVLHAVAWIPGRNDLLLFVFTLASLNNLIRFFNTEKYRFAVYHALLFVCALLAKESAIVLPFLFAMYLVVYKKESSNRFLYFIFSWAAISLLWFFLWDSIVTARTGANAGGVLFKNIVPAFLIFVGKAIVPLQQAVIPTLKSSSSIPGALTLAAIVIAMRYPGVRNKALAGFGLALFFLLLAVPVWFSAVKDGSEYYEHRMYTSMAGLVLFISQLKFNWGSMVLKGVAAMFFVFFCCKTFFRMDVYKNEETFITHGARESPDFYLFLFQKSGSFYSQQQYDSALVYINKALTIRPDRPEMFVNRGSIYYTLGNYKDAAADFEKAIQINTTFDYRMYLSRGFAYYHMGELDKAMKDLLVLKKCCQSVVPADFETEVTSKWKARQDSLH